MRRGRRDEEPVEFSNVRGFVTRLRANSHSFDRSCARCLLRFFFAERVSCDSSLCVSQAEKQQQKIELEKIIEENNKKLVEAKKKQVLRERIS